MPLMVLMQQIWNTIVIEHVMISRITWMEVLVGAGNDDKFLRGFLEDHFEVMSLDLAIAETAIQLRRVHHLRLPDAIILAWATFEPE